MSTAFSPLLSLAAAPPASADAADVRFSVCAAVVASLILLTNFLDVGAVILVVAKLVAVVAFCVAEVPLHHLHGDAGSRDIS